MANYIRVDDRLIHGQIVTGWAIKLNIVNIIAIDDKTAANPMLKSIMTMSVPKSYKTTVVAMNEAQKVIESLGDKNNLIIVRFPAMLPELCSFVPNPAVINIGNVSKKEDAKHEITSNVYLSDADIRAIEGLHNKGLKVTFQLVPDTSLITWEKERGKFLSRIADK